ncbi:bifunctional 2-polyprenyl-6-hydroxyphenol methylase/3-demethylubiquinol 3-O-methyltransferase UbiG [Mangrovimonas sp. TPBH4]|uniref:class I SAM-dependent methyltransferase n=1 Tax=Mangrovimonas sp. TPBH4 TaxID=1645914 RepID=UPI001E50A562|nr:class I SAM-dependent methyltransferase [Mangrovimonas sp. TPBH4]
MSKIYKRFFTLSKANERQELSDDEFYYKLFVENSSWNTKEPNRDESNRWKIIEDYICKIKKDKKDFYILDLGCGRGWLSNLLTDYGNVIGVEPVQSVVSYARQIFPELHFEIGSTKELLKRGFKNKFDLVVSSEVIEHIPNLEKEFFLYDIHKLMKPQGFCIITTPRKEIQKKWNKYTSSIQPIEDWISEDELNNLFEKTGFVREDLKRIAVKVKNKNIFMDVYQVCLFKSV